MSESQPSKVFLFDNSDPEMQNAYEKARATFKYFWRELAWERRRIIPGLDLACVKAPFSDNNQTPAPANPDVEHMWLSDVVFDGATVRGELLNAPNWLKKYKAGDTVVAPLNQISDWMYVISGEVYGAHTVNLMRSRMAPRERREHDQAWGLNFGDPQQIRIVPEPKKSGGLLKSLFGGRKNENSEIQEHPMSEAMGASLQQALAQNPAMATQADEQGWTLLHHQALAGSAATVKVLLDHGAIQMP